MYRRAWLATGSAILAGITIAIVQNKVIPCVTALQEEFGLSLTAFGWLSSIFCVMSILVAFPAALITQRLGVKAACLISLVCTLSGSVLGLLANSVPLLMLSRVVEGAGAGLISITVPTVISMWFPLEKRGLPTGLWSSWQFVAQALCFFFGVTITQFYGWQGVWWSGIIIGTAVLMMCLVWLKEPPAGYSYIQPSETAAVPMGRGLRSPSVWLTSATMFCFCFACFGFVNWAATCWTEQFQIPLDVSNRYVSLFALISLPVVIGVGFLMDRVNRKKFALVISVGYIFAVAAAFLLPSANCILPFVILYPFFEGGVSTCLWTIIPQTVPDSQDVSVAVALFTLASNAGMLIGPPVVGAIVDWGGLWSLGAIPVAAAMAVGTLLLLPVRLTQTT